jgi:DNA-binding protein Fis
MQNQTIVEPIIACNPEAIQQSERDEHGDTVEQIFASILNVKETENGYTLQLPLETPMLNSVIQWVANERLCCSFLTFTLVIGEEFWLELSGSAEVKDYIQAMLIKPD